MRYITEKELRDEFARGVPAEYALPGDARLTPAARQYLTDLRLYRPEAYRQGGTAKAPGPKPEHMTHLTRSKLVHKTHPRIILRGKLDSLEAEILLVQIAAGKQGESILAEQLKDALQLTRRVLAADVTEKPLGSWTLDGMTEKQVHDASHNPKQFGFSGHVLPQAEQGELAALVNRLRAMARETELAAAAAFCQGEGPCGREDLLLALNRLSSYFYVLQLRSIRRKEG